MGSAGEQARLRELFDAAQAGFPGTTVSFEQFAALAGGALASGALASGALAAQQDDAADAHPELQEAAREVFLVAGLKARCAASERAFDADFLQPMVKQLAHLRLGDAGLADLLQRTRLKLLVVAADGRLRIEDYVGRGRLRGLLKVVATREALSDKRSDKRLVQLPDELLCAQAQESLDACSALSKAETRAAFSQAFQAALRGLPVRERTLLRLHLLGGVTLEKLAEMYSVHRATVVRWLAGAREELLKSTRKGLADALSLEKSDLDSLMAAIRPSLDLSVERMFMSVELAELPPSD